MKRRLIVIALVVWAGLSYLGISSPVLAADEERPGGTTGGATVTNKYIWTGDTTRYGQLAVEYTINVVPGSQVYARWECRTRNGPTDYMAGNFSGWSGTVNSASFNGASIVLNDQDDYCAYHVWATTGGFQIPTATVLFWQQEFVGGGGTNPTPNPSQSAGPGTSVGGSPSPSPSAPPPAYDVQLVCGTTPTGDDDLSVGTIHLAVGDEVSVFYEVIGGYWTYSNSINLNMSVSGWTGTPRLAWSEDGVSSATKTGTIVHNAAFGGAESGDVAFACHSNLGSSPPSPPAVHTVWSIEVTYLSGPTFDGDSDADGCTDLDETRVGSDPDVANPTTCAGGPSASPSPTPGPGSCEPGYSWSGTDCVALPPPPPWYPSQPPALPTPSAGPNLGGNGGLEEPAPPDANGNGIGPCEADDGLYSKPGQAPMQALNDTSFPGSINPLDYIPPVMNMVSNFPIVIRNAGQTMVNTGIDFAIPGPCVIDLLTDGADELMGKAPFSIPGEVQTYVSGELASAGSSPIDLCGTIAGTEMCVDLDAIAVSMGPYRGLAGAVVWVIGMIGLYRLASGTLGVNNGGKDQTL